MKLKENTFVEATLPMILMDKEELHDTIFTHLSIAEMGMSLTSVDESLAHICVLIDSIASNSDNNPITLAKIILEAFEDTYKEENN